VKKVEDLVVLAIIATLLIPVAVVTVLIAGSWVAGKAF
jgi:hypothetical protein